MKREHGGGDDDRYGGGSGGRNNFKRQKSDGFSEALAQGKFELRLLVSSKSAGAVIGKGGDNIKRIRSQFDGQISVPDSNTPERIVTITSTCENVMTMVRELMPRLDDGSTERGFVETRLLVHQSHAGALIGRQGSKIKELRERSEARIKVFPQCCPNSTDRIVFITGEEKVIMKAFEAIITELKEIPIKGPSNMYNPMDYDPALVNDYGGFMPTQFPQGGGGGHGGRGGGHGGGGGPQRFGGGRGDGGGGYGGGPPRGGRDHGRDGGRDVPPLRGIGGGYGGDRGGYLGGGDASLGLGGGMGYDRRGGGGNIGGGGGGYERMPPPPPSNMGGPGGPSMTGMYHHHHHPVPHHMGVPPPQQQHQLPPSVLGGGYGSYQASHDVTSTQVTIPSELAGTIIGRGGDRISRIREESGAQIVLESAAQNEERVITITGTQSQIHAAQYLLQQCVRSSMVGRKYIPGGQNEGNGHHHHH